MRNEKYTQKSKQARKPAVTDEFAPLADLLGNLIAKYASVLDPDDGEKESKDLNSEDDNGI